MARRHTPHQVVAKIRQGQMILTDGSPLMEVVRELQVAKTVWYRWLNQKGGCNAEFPKRTKESRMKNARLMTLVAG